jgi:signal transduction histidine kinase/CheY-like chemotaxis protein
MGMGILGTRRLMDDFAIESGPTGTRVTFAKRIPPKAGRIDSRQIERIANEIIRDRKHDPLSEVQHQNQELMQALDELRKKQEELERLNGELEDTNRGVVALYAELDEKADHLRRADELKSKFLNNMSHEFRTPLNSILALSRILSDGTDGKLSPEQERQVGFIRKAAGDLTELVNDLLDLAKVEAGKIVIQPIVFELNNLFGALRGMMRPLLLSESISLVFDEVESIPELYTDEGKLSQILRNLISNALKFTEKGEIRVSASYDKFTDRITLSVADTGIGIPAEHLETIFQEFTQVESETQRRVKGTGLGLPLSRRLAELLGGTLTVESTWGKGSVFSAVIPRRYLDQDPRQVNEQLDTPTPGKVPVLIVDDQEHDMLVYEKILAQSDFEIYAALTLKEAREIYQQLAPDIVILDILLKGEEGWSFLKDLKKDRTTPTKVLVLTSVEDQGRAMALGADGYLVKPLIRETVLGELERLKKHLRRPTALVVDDEEISRYIVRQLLEELGYKVVVADRGEQALRIVGSSAPDLIILDLVMPSMNGFEVAQRLRAQSPDLRAPVVIYTSKVLTPEERAELATVADGVLFKDIATRQDALEMMRNELQRLGSFVELP